MSTLKSAKLILAAGVLSAAAQSVLAYQPYQPRTWYQPPPPPPVAYVQPRPYAPPPGFRGYYPPSPYYRPAAPARPAIGKRVPAKAPLAEPQPRLTAPAAVKPEPADTQVKPLAEQTQKPSIAESKQAFLARLEPIVVAENQRLRVLRVEVSQLVEQLDTSGSLDQEGRQRLKQLARKYRVKGNPVEDRQARRELLDKVDIIPVSLALAQAVNESAWGTSRFAREGNNLFGIWTYDKSKGIVPKRRAEGKTHLVRKFDSLNESVAYYLFTLNSHPAYAKLRELRAASRAKGEVPHGLVLAAGLLKYSAKGEEYVRLIRDIIHRYDLASRAMPPRA